MQKKKYLIALNIMAAIWIAAFVQIVTNELFAKENAFIEAYTTSENEVMESHLEITASYGDKYLTDKEKEDLLRFIATDIGLTEGYKLESINENGKRIVKNGNQAGTLITIVTNQETNKQYIHFKLDLFESPNQISRYKNKMEQCLKKIKAEEWQTTMGLQSTFQGKLDWMEIDEMAERMLKALNAKVITKYTEEDMYTVYAYTNSIQESMMVNGDKINVHIAARYEESEDRTVLYYSTPILNVEF